jgi:hypothetical protein
LVQLPTEVTPDPLVDVFMYSFGKGIAGVSVPETEAERQSPESEVESRLKNATKNFRYQLVHGGVYSIEKPWDSALMTNALVNH